MPHVSCHINFFNLVPQNSINWTTWFLLEGYANIPKHQFIHPSDSTFLHTRGLIDINLAASTKLSIKLFLFLFYYGFLGRYNAIIPYIQKAHFLFTLPIIQDICLHWHLKLLRQLDVVLASFHIIKTLQISFSMSTLNYCQY